MGENFKQSDKGTTVISPGVRPIEEGGLGVSEETSESKDYGNYITAIRKLVVRNEMN